MLTYTANPAVKNLKQGENLTQLKDMLVQNMYAFEKVQNGSKNYKIKKYFEIFS